MNTFTEANTSAHPVTPEEIMAMLDRELPADEASAVFDHVRHCADCANIAVQFGDLQRELSSWRVEPVPSKVDENVVVARQAQPAGQKSFTLFAGIRRLLSRRSLAVGLSALALGCLLLIVATQRAGRPRLESYYSPSPNSMGNAASAPTPPNSAGEIALIERPGLASPTDRFTGSDTTLLAEKQKLEQQTEAYRQALQARQQAALSSSLAKDTGDETSDEPVQTDIHQPMIARSVSLTLITKDFSSVRPALDTILARHHGYAAQLSANTAENSPRSITASLRVPANQLTAALVDLRTLGHVESESQSGEEVTQQHADLVARLKNSRETEQRLQDILRQRTGKIADVLEVEREIARVRGDIEGMEVEQKNLEHRVNFATLDLQISEEYKEQIGTSLPSSGTRIRNAAVSGYRHAAETLLGFALFFFESGPTLLIWLMVLFIPTYFIFRRYRRALASA